ncbi:MAG: hypothetical protein ACYC1M_15165 [Armatimonadota bacterium]
MKHIEATRLIVSFSLAVMLTCCTPCFASGGTIEAWGLQRAIPGELTGFKSIAAGTNHTVGLKIDGSVACWGRNDDGQCNVPVPNENFKAIAGGSGHTIGLKLDSSVACWRNNEWGQCDLPVPNHGFYDTGAYGVWNIALHSVENIHMQFTLNNYGGNVYSQQFSAVINSTSVPSTNEYFNQLPRTMGGFALTTYLRPPYDIRMSSPHFLTAKVANFSPGRSASFSLVNGDGDGDGQINLFDFVVLDSKFGSSDPMADLDGDGQVNLFDYVVIDQSFGARGT